MQRQAFALAQKCSNCNLRFEDSSAFAPLRPIQRLNSTIAMGPVHSTGVITPLANCLCVDCPIIFERHRLREAELEATAINISQRPGRHR